MTANSPTKKLEKFFLLYLNITKNNFKVSISDFKGKVLYKKTEGMLKGVRKGSINSSDTSLIMMNVLSEDINSLGISSLGIYLKGATRWKKLSLRRLFLRLRIINVSIKFVRDLTEVPHNGCTLPSKKRKRKRRSLKKKYFMRGYFITKKSTDMVDYSIKKKIRRRSKKSNKFLKYIKKL